MTTISGETSVIAWAMPQPERLAGMREHFAGHVVAFDGGLRDHLGGQLLDLAAATLPQVAGVLFFGLFGFDQPLADFVGRCADQPAGQRDESVRNAIA